jgi:hypothetical protein
MKKKVTLKIPHELYLALQKMIEKTGFVSVNEFVVFVMRTVVKGGKIGDDSRLTHDEKESIRKRLVELGYI